MAVPSSTTNGPILPMYSLKAYQVFDVVDVPIGMYKVKSYHTTVNKACSNNTPLEVLETRQEDVLNRLHQLQATLDNLTKKYNASTVPGQTVSGKTSDISATLSATTAAVTTAAFSTKSSSCQPSQSLPQNSDHVTRDLVISVDPSTVPLSLAVLCSNLRDGQKVFKSTFIHSSVSSDVPDRLQHLLTNKNGIRRDDSDLIVNLVWKKVVHGPHLVVDPTRQTAIQGEANVARYLARRLGVLSDETDMVTATLVDEFLDLAQLQLIEGSSKEKAAAVKTLNSALGKKDWLAGSGPSVADVVCWSALHQIGQSSAPPANVKRWLSLCSQHCVFQTAVDLVA